MSETTYPASRGSSLLTQVAELAQSGLEVDNFLVQFFDKVSLAMEADGGSFWLYSLPEKKLVCRLDRTPEDQASGDLSRAQVSRLVVKCMEESTPALVASPEARPASDEEHRLSVICVPYSISEQLRAAIFLYRLGKDKPAFRRDNAYICQSLSAYVSVYFANYNLRQSERRSQRLNSLVDIAREVASLLNPERIAYAIVNRALEVIDCERAFLALARPGGGAGEKKNVEVLAISRLDEIHKGSAQVQTLKKLASWGASNAGDWYFTEEFMNSSDDPELKELLAGYFKLSGMKACMALSLKDSDGAIGVLALESEKPRNYTAVDFTLAGHLARLSTSALRSALEHRSLPAIRLLESTLRLKGQIATRRRKLLAWLALMAALVAAMVFVPVPFRVGGDCQVVPVERRYLNSGLDAVVQEVFVKEGDLVEEGSLIAKLDDKELRNSLGEAEQRLKFAQAQMRSLVADPADRFQYELKELEAGRIKNEIALLKGWLDLTSITSPITGTVMTPYIENLNNKQVRRGELICEIANLERLVLEIAIRESQVSYVQVGQRLKFVINSFPGEEMKGELEKKRQKSEPRAGRNVFVVTSALDNSAGRYSPGMEGYAKITVGSKPVGFVLFRRLINYFRTRMF